MKRFFLFFFLLFFGGFSLASSVELITKEVFLDIDSRKMAQEQALGELSRELVIETIGEEKFEREEKRIQNYIIKNKNRYILSTRFSPAVLQEDGRFLFSLKIEISRENLKQLLLEHNLFYDSKGSSCLLPVVSFSSHFSKGKETYSWWTDSSEKSSLKTSAKAFFDLLGEKLIPQGFYTLNPVLQKMKEGTPSFALPGKSLRVKNFVPLASFYTCDIILLGYIQMGEKSGSSSSLSGLFSSFVSGGEESFKASYSTRFSFNVFNIKTRQFLFKLRKEFPFSSSSESQAEEDMLLRAGDVLDSLSYQLASFGEEGSLDLNRLTISVQGPLSYSEKERLKNLLVRNVPGLQSLEERFLTSNRLVYLAESSQKISSIARQIKKASLPGFSVQIKGYGKKQLEIYAKRTAR